MAERGTKSNQSTPTLRERIYVPPRLRELLTGGLDAGTLQVQAPAGCGKTAVVLQVLLDAGIDPYWYTCRAEDEGPAHLLAGLIKALRRADTVGGQTALAALASRDVRQSYRVALRPLLDEFADEAEAQQVLVIDDVEAIVHSPLALEVLDYAVTALSPFLRIVLVGRVEPELPSLAKPRLEGRVVRVVADDLFLRADEIAECAQSSYGVRLSPDETAVLFRVTAGWGIALRLALRLRDLGAGVESDQRSPFTPEARADLFSYLAAEVLSKVDARVASFLRRTAILDTLDPAVCERLTHEERSAELIQSLAGAGLPVMKAGWSAYRCHSLLRDYFLDSMSERELRDARRDAGQAFADLGDWPQALSYLVAADEISAALSIADEHGRQLFHTGQGRMLFDLVKAAPPEMLGEHYRAEYWAAFAASRLLDLDWASAAFERVHAAAVARGDVPMAQDALRSLAHVLNGWGRFLPAMEVATRLLDTVPEDDIAGRAAVTLGYLTTGMGGTDQFREAMEIVRKRLPELRVEPRTDPAAEAYARAVAGVTLGFGGDFAAGRAELNLADVLVTGLEYDSVATFVAWSRALIEFQAANVDAAERAARTAEELALQFGDLQRVLECRAVLASVEIMRGNVAEGDAAFARLDELRAGGADYWGIIFTLLSKPQRARMHGDLAAGLAAAEANHALAAGLSGAWFVCSTRMEVADFRLLTGDVEAARMHARQALEEAQALSSSLLLYGAYLMIAATGADDEATAMAAALRIADEGDLRFLLPYAVRLPQLDAALWRALGTDAGSRAAILLESTGAEAAAALRPMIPELGETAAIRAVAVLRAYGSQGRDALTRLAAVSNRAIASAAKDALAAMEAANPHGLSRRELEVLQLMAQGMRTKEIAEKLVLTPATVSTHIQRIMNKTRTSSRPELLALALREVPAGN